MARNVPIHCLRPNETTWTPPAVAFFDTETQSHAEGTSEIHELRCWSAQLNVRRDRRKNTELTSSDDGVHAFDLAELISYWASKHPTLWVYAHNLGFDLSVSSVTTHLAELGWTATEFALDSVSPWVRMARGRSVLTFCDSFSWLPARLADVAAQMGTEKEPLPGDSGTMADWHARCRRDTQILAAAMLALMQWWDARQLGRWSVTGSASGWNVLRHRIDARRFTINPDPRGIEADRAAIYGGRRGVARSGVLPAGRYAELDFASAYTSVAAHLPLPLERMASFDGLPPGHRWLSSDRHGVIASVRLRTDNPRWPVRIGRRVWYPVGEFVTTLAGPDIAEAAAMGALAQIGPGYVHRLGYALKPWADWCIGVASGADGLAPAAARMAAKHWGRAEIGKWAQRGFSTVEIGPAPTRGWDASEAWNHTAGTRATIIDFDGRRWQATASGNGDNCYPAVLAFVEAHVRVRLGRLIDALPAGSAVAYDTDGMLIDLRYPFRVENVSQVYGPLTARIKNTYVTAEIIGPQHMILDGRRRFAGIPAGARKEADGRLYATLWPKMIWQMANGSQGSYTRPVASYAVAPTYAPGWVLSDYTVVPVEVTADADGSNRIVPWQETRHAAAGLTLAAEQNKSLERYRNDRQTERT